MSIGEFVELRKAITSEMFDASPERLREIIREMLPGADGPHLAILLEAWRYCFHCPDFAMDLMDELRRMDAAGTTPPEDYLDWTERARSYLQLYVVDGHAA